MKENKIVVEIDENGKINAETFGMEGVGCIDELNKLMRDLATLTDIEKKPDFYKCKVLKTNTKRINR